MYADQIASGRKRSIKERLHGDVGGDFSHSSAVPAKRQRQSDDKWKHDLYDEDREHETFKSVNPNDLRWKLQNRGSQQAFQSGKVSAVRDLRDKLTGTMHSQPSNSEPSKAKRMSEISEAIKKSLRNDPPIPETKKTNAPKKASQSKSVLSVDGFLDSLGLGKYSITFQAEEVDMTVLKHMNDEDLRALGIPMVVMDEVFHQQRTNDFGLPASGFNGYFSTELSPVPSVEEIDLATNGVTFILSTEFSPVPSVEEIDLATNGVTFILSTEFSPVPSVEELDLATSSVPGLSPKAWSSMLSGLKPTPGPRNGEKARRKTTATLEEEQDYKYRSGHNEKDGTKKEKKEQIWGRSS
ncbi:hypothetical protein ZIOFF_010671 [Zingiber officinale]|uniref:SAM domain-containing protein n=1 Tax=Zingiber officinale TaxID=94328 RepID=A0A8J5LK47_ZINOF|nr:hypothetical protein ZIOFF_010671 [Zingiber officinale]